MKHNTILCTHIRARAHTTQSIINFHLNRIKIVEKLRSFSWTWIAKTKRANTHHSSHHCKKIKWYAPYEILKSSEEIRTNQLIAKSRSTRKEHENGEPKTIVIEKSAACTTISQPTIWTWDFYRLLKCSQRTCVKNWKSQYQHSAGRKKRYLSFSLPLLKCEIGVSDCQNAVKQQPLKRFQSASKLCAGSRLIIEYSYEACEE